MALPRAQVSDGLIDELGRFEELIRGLDASIWDQPSRCAGWSVGDVARHVVGSMADVAAGRLDGLGTPEVTEREVAERARRTPAELADECAEVVKAAAGLLPLFDDAAWAGPAPGGYEGTLGDGVEALWYDTWMHADDIRAATGEATQFGPAWPGVVSHVRFELAKRGWNGDVIDSADAAGLAFVMAATGRSDGADLGATRPINIYA
jgi:uncharacterized protein (TIGR03083 family)